MYYLFILLLLVFNNEVQHGAATIRPGTQVQSDAIRGYFDESRRFGDDRFGTLCARVQDV